MKIINRREKNSISKRLKKVLMNYAKEASELDPSRTIGFYYQLFIDRYRKKCVPKTVKEQFFNGNTIEN